MARPQPARDTNTLKTIATLFVLIALNFHTPPPTPYAPVGRTGPYKEFTVRLSYYWPPFGGTNCHPANWQEPTPGNPGKCVTHLAGEPWSTWVKIGAACPPSIPLNSRIHIIALNKSFYCVDRGGAIQTLPDGTAFVDLLQPDAPYLHKGPIIKDKYCPSGCYTSKAYILP